MSEEIEQEKKEPVAEPPKKEQEPAPPAEAKNTDHMIPKARLDEEIQKRKDLEKQAKENAKRLEDFEKAEATRKQAEMSESEKATARIKELEEANALKDQQLKQKDRQDLQLKIAKSVAKELGLPVEAAEGLADRLKGNTEEEITEDAKVVFALLPKQEADPKKPTAPKLEPTNPGGAKQGETRAQLKQRVLGGNTNTWDSNFGKSHGGGVTLVEKE